MATFGNTATPTAEDFTQGYLLGVPVTATESGTLTSLSGYCRSSGTGGSVLLGFCSDLAGAPDTVIVATSSVAEPINASQQLVNGSVTPTDFSPGDYWIVIGFESGDVNNHRVGKISTGTLYFHIGTGLPSPMNWTTGEHGTDTGLACLFGTYSTSSGDKTLSPTGFGLNMSLGSPTVQSVFDRTVNPAGFSLSMSLGTPTIKRDSTQTPVGFGLSMLLGTPTINIQNDTNITVSPVGFGLNMQLGTPTLSGADRTLNVSGFGLGMALGVPSINIQNGGSGFMVGRNIGVGVYIKS